MKYVVKVRKTIVTEAYVEIEADNVIQAMDKAEDYSNARELHNDKWVAVAVNEDNNE